MNEAEKLHAEVNKHLSIQKPLQRQNKADISIYFQYYFWCI